MEIEERTTSFIVFGLTGSGKSTLANAAIGEMNRFKEGEGIESETTIVDGVVGMFDDHHKVFVIDTPGMLDSEGRDQEHLDKITKYVKEQPMIKAFVVVIDFEGIKINEGIRRLFELLEQMYPEKEWYKHIVIVWSNFNNELSENEKGTLSYKREGVKQVIRETIPKINQTELNSIPQYFLDNREAKTKNTESHQKLREMIECISILPTLS